MPKYLLLRTACGFEDIFFKQLLMQPLYEKLNSHTNVNVKCLQRPGSMWD